MTNTGAKPDPGWWQCDSCNADVRPSKAETMEKPGHRETVTLAFCPECWTEGGDD